MANDIQMTRELAVRAAKQIVQLAHDNKASHVGGALSVVDILAVLYGSILQYNPLQSGEDSRDRFFYSKGHACTALYAILHEVGFYDKVMLDSFTKDGSYLTSHVNHRVPGVEWSTGSLGHALNVACGTALAAVRKKAAWKVIALLSDGELDEGSNWEAILFAPHHRLSNLTLIVDYNKIQSFGTVKEVLNLDPLCDKFTAFGWEVVETDGHDHAALHQIFSQPAHPAKPRAVIANTVKGKGVPFMENELAWHYKSPDANQLKEALHALENK
jgi:transketolase